MIGGSGQRLKIVSGSQVWMVEMDQCLEFELKEIEQVSLDKLLADHLERKPSARNDVFHLVDETHGPFTGALFDKITLVSERFGGKLINVFCSAEMPAGEIKLGGIESVKVLTDGDRLAEGAKQPFDL